MPLLRRKSVDITAWHLVGLAEMAEAFNALTAEGWRGTIGTGEGGALQLQMNADDPTRQIIAGIGDWLIQDMGVRLVSADECAANYDEVSGS